MWWNQQNLNKPHIDQSGKKWNFRVWHDFLPGRHVACVFFWDDKRKSCGAVPVSPVRHVSRVHNIIEKLAADPALRAKYKMELHFPLERYYSEHGAFPNEKYGP